MVLPWPSRWRHWKRWDVNVICMYMRPVTNKCRCPITPYLSPYNTYTFFPDEPNFLRSNKALWPSDSRWSHISVGLKLTFQGQFNQVEKLAEISRIHAELRLTSCAPLSCSDLWFGAESCSSVFGDFVKWVNNPGTLSSFGDPKHSGFHQTAAAALPPCSPQPRRLFSVFEVKRLSSRLSSARLLN